MTTRELSTLNSSTEPEGQPENPASDSLYETTITLIPKPDSSVQSSHSVVSDSLRPHELQHARPPCPSNSRRSPRLMCMESMMPSSHLILCHSLLLLPPIPPSNRVFSNESTLCMRWPKDWRFSFNISPSNEYSGLVSFRIDWLDLLAVQGTLKSLLQHHSSVQFSHSAVSDSL